MIYKCDCGTEIFAQDLVETDGKINYGGWLNYPRLIIKSRTYRCPNCFKTTKVMQK